MALTIKMNQKWIEKTEFFKDKSFDVVATISMHLKHFKTNKNEVIYVEGDPSNEMYFILEGEVCFFTKHEGKELVYDSLGEGKHFGELELLLEL